MKKVELVFDLREACYYDDVDYACDIIDEEVTNDYRLGYCTESDFEIWQIRFVVDKKYCQKIRKIVREELGKYKLTINEDYKEEIDEDIKNLLSI